MSIPIVKFDPELPALDDFFEGHQRPEDITEGWVTINGRHILIGDDNQKMVGAAKHDKEFSGTLTPEQQILADKIQKYFESSWDAVHGGNPGHGTMARSNVVNDAAKELASAGFNDKILENAPLAGIEINDNKVHEEASETAAAFYDPRKQTMTLSSSVKNPVVIHEFGHHLDYSWSHGDLAGKMGVAKADVLAAGEKSFQEGRRINNAIQGKLTAYAKTAPPDAGGYVSPELSRELDRMVISRYAASGGPAEWMAEGVRQYTSSPRGRAALKKQFPDTYTYVHGLIAGEFPKASE